MTARLEAALTRLQRFLAAFEPARRPWSHVLAVTAALLLLSLGATLVCFRIPARPDKKAFRIKALRGEACSPITVGHNQICKR